MQLGSRERQICTGAQFLLYTPVSLPGNSATHNGWVFLKTLISPAFSAANLTTWFFNVCLEGCLQDDSWSSQVVNTRHHIYLRSPASTSLNAPFLCLGQDCHSKFYLKWPQRNSTAFQTDHCSVCCWGSRVIYFPRRVKVLQRSLKTEIPEFFSNSLRIWGRHESRGEEERGGGRRF